MILLMMLSLQCPDTKIINKTKEWNKIDQMSYNSAKERCSYYYPDAPCLKTFIKTEVNAYRAICSRKK